jgi:uncharacterized protein (AIM24 family)
MGIHTDAAFAGSTATQDQVGVDPPCVVAWSDSVGYWSSGANDNFSDT